MPFEQVLNTILSTVSMIKTKTIIFTLVTIIIGALALEIKYWVFPIHGVFLIGYLTATTVCTAWLTFVSLQKVLTNNKPFKYKSVWLLRFIALLSLQSIDDPPKRTDLDTRINHFIDDVEKRYVTKWYMAITDDPTFPSEAKLLLDELVRRFLQVVVDVDTKKLIYATSIVWLKHIKEFKRALRRSRKGNLTVEDLFRYSHIGSQTTKSFDYFVHQISLNVLRQFINWELWNSLPCRMLVAIVSKKLVRYLLTLISSPGFLTYQLVKACACDDTKLRLQLDQYAFISVSDVDHNGSLSRPQQKLEMLKIEETCTPKISPKKMLVKPVIDRVDSSRKAKMKLETRPKPSEPVKIHESRSTNKHWRNSSDLECISLGQDLLAFEGVADPNVQLQEFIGKKLWKDNTADEDVQEEDEVPLIPNYLTTTSLLTNTMKPLGNVTANTLHNMKELQQTTVNTMSNVVKPMSLATTNAMHKIGDLQDEAAGVVEGIFDFGMAGLRKGLRLTGLQENISELTQKAKNEFNTHKLEAQRTIDLQKPYIGKITEAIKIIDRDYKLVKGACVSSERQHQSSSESEESSVWVNPLNNSSPSFEGDILLEKTPDSLPKMFDLPQITEDTVSPDLEYEEVQDFASTIAKLRCLLQQKSSESSLTTPALSPMPQEETLKTPAEPPLCDITKADGAMPSLYKFCARTATGVFQNTLNTIKTALPGTVNEATHNESDNWTFVETDSMVDDFHSRLKRLLSERRAYCTVDTAYEAIDSFQLTDKVDWTPSPCTFEDDMDEFDVHIPITKAAVDIICELLGDSNTYLLRESVVKALLLIVGNFTEDLIDKKAETLLHLPARCIGGLPDNAKQNVLVLKLDEVVKICMGAFPDLALLVLGESTLELGLRLFISSLQSPKINKDVFIQVLEVFASQLMVACGNASPAYSA